MRANCDRQLAKISGESDGRTRSCPGDYYGDCRLDADRKRVGICGKSSKAQTHRNR